MQLEDLSLDNPSLYVSRELAWLRFNERVLGEAADESTPLLEKIKFLSIFSSNLDEFFMVRLSGALRLAERKGFARPGNFAATVAKEVRDRRTLDSVAQKVKEDLKAAHGLLHHRVFPELTNVGAEILEPSELKERDLLKLREFFRKRVFPVLTPLAVDPAHPFPYLSNLSLYLAVQFEQKDELDEPLLAFVEVPAQLARFVPLANESGRGCFILLEDVIRLHLDTLFPWTEVSGAYLVRVTRNLDYQLLEGEVQDLMRSIEIELKDREQKFVLRLEIERSMPKGVKNRLQRELDLDPSDTYAVPRLVGAVDLKELLNLDLGDSFRDPPFNPRLRPDLAEAATIFKSIREKDVLLHHPFDSFLSVVEFVDVASRDPSVLAIKMTLYRCGGFSPIVEALVRAAERGTQVTVVIELKARFDEENNINWARRLERAGAHVVFGFVGLKTHAKALLVVRKEGDNLQHYVHMSTGNYNHSTAKLYTDFGFFTADAKITADVANLFNLLTGFNILGSSVSRSVRLPRFERLFVAPFDLRDQLLLEVEREVAHHQQNGGGRMVMKMNALTDMQVIQAFYRASQAGVRIDLIVRGVCLLRPGMKGVSENIRVRSLIDRFLEHSRIYWFFRGGEIKVFLSSADLMSRNLDRRIEICWPLLDGACVQRVTEMLDIQLADNVKAHQMQPNGKYRKVQPRKGQPEVRSQSVLISHARREGLKSAEYDHAVGSSRNSKLSNLSPPAPRSRLRRRRKVESSRK